MSAVPRVVVSAPSSGHGKTALAVGLLAAFTARGLSAVGFKVGPDHTDAAYLGAAAGRPGRNLDPRLVGPHRIAPLFAHGAEGHEIAVIEGTMGLFDSLAGRVETDSTAGVAATLRAPVVLVVDVGAMGQSIAALVHGFRSYDELVWLGGVILNRVASDRHEQLISEALDDIGVPVFGALRRRDLPSALPPRHEGVVPVAHRGVDALRGIRRLGESVAATVDLDRLLALARSAPHLGVPPWSPAGEVAGGDEDTANVVAGRRPVIALAGGPALSFGYAETRELLQAAGATVVSVDPLRDESLPAGTDALVIGGALPEAYTEELSANARLRAEVADLARAGRPVIAEGAGLLWLTRAFDGRPMCGVLDAVGVTGEQMVVGYRDATARASTPVAQLGARVVGYKQHRGIVTPRAGQTPAWTWPGGAPEGFVWRRVHASQLMVHWAGVPEIARRFVAAAQPVGGGGVAAAGWAGPTGAVPVVSSVPAGPVAPGPRGAGGAGDGGVAVPAAGGDGREAQGLLGVSAPGPRAGGLGSPGSVGGPAAEPSGPVTVPSGPVAVPSGPVTVPSGPVTVPSGPVTVPPGTGVAGGLGGAAGSAVSVGPGGATGPGVAGGPGGAAGGGPDAARPRTAAPGPHPWPPAGPAVGDDDVTQGISPGAVPPAGGDPSAGDRRGPVGPAAAVRGPSGPGPVGEAGATGRAAVGVPPHGALVEGTAEVPRLPVHGGTRDEDRGNV